MLVRKTVEEVVLRMILIEENNASYFDVLIFFV